jgi:uncharacterized cupin superfamily protein
MAAQGPAPRYRPSEAPLTWFDLGEGISGYHAILYRSEDGTRLAGSFKESGVHDLVLPCDEFLHVIAGSTRITVKGQEPFELTVGECCYLTAGTDVKFEHSEDFQDMVVLISDEPIDLGDG